MHDYTTRVVRDTIYGSAKFHIGTGPRSSACGVEPSCVGTWTNSGSRADFERLCPERICKRCRRAEDQLSRFDSCTRCGQTTTGDGTVCHGCAALERAPQGETVRLFEPAPVQMAGQTGLDI